MKYKYDVSLRKLVETDGQHLTKEQQEYFKDSKLRDRDGDLVQCFHYTDWEFDAFDKNFITEDSFCGRGFYFTSMTTFGSGFGKNCYECYIDMRNPLVVEDLCLWDKTDLLKYFAENHPDYAADDNLPRIAGFPKKSERGLADEIKSLMDEMAENHEFGELCQEIQSSWQYSEFLKSGDVCDLLDYYKFEELRECSCFHEIIEKIEEINILTETDLTSDNFHYGVWNGFSAQLTVWAEDHGYDGILSESNPDCHVREIVVFEPNQIKSVDCLYPTRSDNFREKTSLEEIKKKVGRHREELPNMNQAYKHPVHMRY